MSRRRRDSDDDDAISTSEMLERLFSDAVPGVASVDKVARNAFAVGYRPNERLLVSELADKHRWLSGVGASEPGRWRTERTPYLRELMDNMSAGSPVWKQSFVSGVQTGKTEGANNCLFAWMTTAPGPIMVVLPSAGVAKKFSKQRLTPMIQSSPFLRSKVTEDLQLTKEFLGGLLFLASAESGADLRSLPIRYLYCDEVDAYTLAIPGEGPPVELAENRTNTFMSKRKVYLTSTPTRESTSVIWREFLLGDQRLYHMPCPHPACGELMVFEFEGLKWEWGKAAETVHYECPHCKNPVYEYQKATMLPAGQWIPTRKDLENVPEGVRSYRLNSLYSPLGWLSWVNIAQKWEHCYQSPMRIAEFRNTILGLPSVEVSEKIDWETVWHRGDIGDPYSMMPNGRTIIPKGVLFLTAGIDLGQDHIEVGVWGYGRHGQEWFIEQIRIEGSPDQEAVWDQLTIHLAHVYQNAEGVAFSIKKRLYDTSYRPELVKRYLRRQNQVLDMGIDPMDSKPQPVKVEVQAEPVPGNPSKKTVVGALKIVQGDVSFFKSELVGKLNIPTPSDTTEPPVNWVHFPVNHEGVFTKEHAMQITSERKVIIRDANGMITGEKWVRIEGRRAEVLDCRNYARIAAYLLGWDRWKDPHFDRLEATLSEEANAIREAAAAEARGAPVVTPPKTTVGVIPPKSKAPSIVVSAGSHAQQPTNSRVTITGSDTPRRIVPLPKMPTPAGDY